MKTISITYTYNVKGHIDDQHILTECGKVIHVLKGKEIKPQLRGSKKMWLISGKWQGEFKLNTNRVECPF